MLENTFGYAVAAPTVQRGFVTPDFWGGACWARSKVLGGMGLPARLAARRIPCFQHPVHPLRLKTYRVGSEPRYGALPMANFIALVRPAAPPQPTHGTTTDPETLRLHGLAENALATALHSLRATDCSPAKLQLATARAVRAATLLKRASAAVTVCGGGASCK